VTTGGNTGRRRPYGTGSVQDLGSGKFRLRVFAGTDPVTGHPLQISRVVRAKTKGQAQKLLDEFRSEVGTEPEYGPGATVATALSEWMKHCEARGRSPRTLHEGRRIIDTVLVPKLGDVALRDLTPRHLDELYRKLSVGEGRERGLSPGSVRRYHAVLSAALSQAVRWGWLESNPAARAEPPPLGQAVLTVPTAAEVKALLSAARERAPKWGMLLALAVGTGARRGELCALRWTDIADGTIRIRRSIYRAGADRGEKSTKGGRERLITIGPVVDGLLEDWRAECEAAAAAVAVKLVPDAFVVSSMPDGSVPINPDTLSAVVTRLCATPTEDNPKGLGMPHVHLHSLRHFAATELIGAGVNPRDAAEILGHADPALTLRVYSHATTARQKQAAAALGEAVRSALPD
jgi:integrase